jgi:DNA-binding MarR family transcriptional regulator
VANDSLDRLDDLDDLDDPDDLDAQEEPPGQEAWRLIAEMVFSAETQARFASACAAANLTPPLLKALLSLEPDGAEPMRVLAKGWGCDASWVTGIVDGLEERAYVERRVLATDRRVKVVQITPLGERAKARAFERLHEPPAAITALDPADQQALRDLLRKVRSQASPRGPHP